MKLNAWLGGFSFLLLSFFLGCDRSSSLPRKDETPSSPREIVTRCLEEYTISFEYSEKTLNESETGFDVAGVRSEQGNILHLVNMEEKLNVIGWGFSNYQITFSDKKRFRWFVSPKKKSQRGQQLSF